MANTSRSMFQLGHGLMISCAVFGAIALASQHPWMVRAEGQAQTFLMRLRGPIVPPDNVVILAIDEYSLSQGSFYTRDEPASAADSGATNSGATNFAATNPADANRYDFLAPLANWPWRREAYALAIDRLMAAGAEVVALDVLLVDPSLYGPEDDAALATTLERWGDQVVLATAYDASTLGFGEFTSLLTPIFGDLAAVGLINVRPDADGQHRASPDYALNRLRQEHGWQDELPSFAAATVQAAGQPLPQRPSMALPFYGPTGTIPYLSFVQVLDPENWPLFQAQVANKIVLIGPTATSLQDLKRTPLDEAMPGVEIHAQAVAALLEGRTLNPAIANPVGQGLAAAVALGVLGLGLGYRLTQPLSRLLGFGLAIVAWGAIAYLLMAHRGRLIPLAIPVACLGMGGVAYIATDAVGNRLEEQRLRRTLARYVSPAVAQEILNQPEDFTSLTVGHRMQAAVLFSDIRGFSRMSYQMEATAVVSLLNTYLDAMVTAILTHRGTIDKFIGDAVMAEFGVPTSQGAAQDALSAVQAALAMRQALADLRLRFQEQGLPPLYHGIGISYGDLVVGNVGSIQRLEYTAIGDTVNVASRIESLTKRVGADLLITQPLYDLVKDDIIAIDHGQHILAGREQEAVQVYGVVGLRGNDDGLYHQVQRELADYLDHVPPGPEK